MFSNKLKYERIQLSRSWLNPGADQLLQMYVSSVIQWQTPRSIVLMCLFFYDEEKLIAPHSRQDEVHPMSHGPCASSWCPCQHSSEIQKRPFPNVYAALANDAFADFLACAAVGLSAGHESKRYLDCKWSILSCPYRHCCALLVESLLIFSGV